MLSQPVLSSASRSSSSSSDGGATASCQRNASWWDKQSQRIVWRGELVASLPFTPPVHCKSICMILCIYWVVIYRCSNFGVLTCLAKRSTHTNWTKRESRKTRVCQSQLQVRTKRISEPFSEVPFDTTFIIFLSYSIYVPLSVWAVLSWGFWIPLSGYRTT